MKEHDTERAAAEYAGVSVALLRKRRRLGLPPPFIRISTRIVYSRSDIDSFLAKHRVTPVSGEDPASGPKQGPHGGDEG